MRTRPELKDKAADIKKQKLTLVVLLYDFCKDLLQHFTRSFLLKDDEDKLKEYANNVKHKLYHCNNGNSKCCKCTSQEMQHYSSVYMNKRQYDKLYLKAEVLPVCDRTEKHVCNIGARNDLSLSAMDVDILHILILASNIEDIKKEPIKILYEKRRTIHKLYKKANDPIEFDTFWTDAEQTVEQIGKLLGGESCALSYKKFMAYRKSFEQQIADHCVEIMMTEFEQGTSDTGTDIASTDPPANTASTVETLSQVINLEAGVVMIGNNNVAFSGLSETMITKLNALLQEEKQPESNRFVHLNNNTVTIVDSSSRLAESSSSGDEITFEWRISGNGLNEQKMEQILKAVKGFELQIGVFIKIKFVHKGSVVIGTSMQTSVVENQEIFLKAVGQFLDNIFKVCGIDTTREMFIKVNIARMQDEEHYVKAAGTTICSKCEQKETTLLNLLSTIRSMEKDVLRVTGDHGKVQSGSQHDCLRKTDIPTPIEKKLCVKCTTRDIELKNLKKEILELKSKYNSSKNKHVYCTMYRKVLSDSSIAQSLADDENHVYSEPQDHVTMNQFKKVRCNQNYVLKSNNEVILEVKTGDEFRLLGIVGDWFELMSGGPDSSSFFMMAKYAEILEPDTNVKTDDQKVTMRRSVRSLQNDKSSGCDVSIAGKMQKNPQFEKNKKMLSLHFQRRKTWSPSSSVAPEEIINSEGDDDAFSDDNTLKESGSQRQSKSSGKPDFLRIWKILTNFFSKRPSRESLERQGYLRVSVMGLSLEELCLRDKVNDNVPILVKKCTQAIERKVAESKEQIYVKRDYSQEVSTRRDQVWEGKYDFTWSDMDVKTLSDLLISVLEELKSPVLPFDICSIMLTPEKTERLKELKKRIQSLPDYNKKTFQFLLSHFHSVIAKTRTEVKKVSKIIGPALIWPDADTDYRNSWIKDEYPAKLMMLCLDNYDVF